MKALLEFELPINKDDQPIDLVDRMQGEKYRAFVRCPTCGQSSELYVNKTTWCGYSCPCGTSLCLWTGIDATSLSVRLQDKVDKFVAWVKGDGPLYLEGCQAQQVEDQLLAKLRELGLKADEEKDE